jgi:hypothetical protein
MDGYCDIASEEMETRRETGCNLQEIWKKTISKACLV